MPFPETMFSKRACLMLREMKVPHISSSFQDSQVPAAEEYPHVHGPLSVGIDHNMVGAEMHIRRLMIGWLS